jgi:hypothetical protein
MTYGMLHLENSSRTIDVNKFFTPVEPFFSQAMRQSPAPPPASERSWMEKPIKRRPWRGRVVGELACAYPRLQQLPFASA